MGVMGPIKLLSDRRYERVDRKCQKGCVERWALSVSSDEVRSSFTVRLGAILIRVFISVVLLLTAICLGCGKLNGDHSFERPSMALHNDGSNSLTVDANAAD